jgi:hypothetical protein
MGDKKAPERGDLVAVYWWDIEEDSTWKPVALIELAQPPLCKNVGWYLSEDEKCVRILHSISGTEDGKIEAGSTVIPKTVIRNIEIIREDELDTE